MNADTITTRSMDLADALPACQRCHRGDRHGLANIRGLMLCGLCALIAKARWFA